MSREKCVYVDIDLEDFDTDELIEEITKRPDYISGAVHSSEEVAYLIGQMWQAFYIGREDRALVLARQIADLRRTAAFLASLCKSAPLAGTIGHPNPPESASPCPAGGRTPTTSATARSPRHSAPSRPPSLSRLQTSPSPPSCASQASPHSWFVEAQDAGKEA